MIQRIQTIFLILVIALMAAFLALPIWGKMDTDSGEVYEIKALALVHIPSEGAEPILRYTPFAIVGGVAVLIILVTLFSIFKYKNRVLQMQLGMVNSILILVVLGLLMWEIFTGQNEWLPLVAGSFGAGLFMPAVAMVFNRMAIRSIKKDEDLVRSVDRIR